MSIASDALRKAGPFAGDGTTVTFPFTFKIFSTSDVLVVLTSASSVESELSSGYTVAMNADQDTSPGGTVTMATAPATGELLTIGSQVAATQLVELTNSGGFYPAVINTALDKLTALIQQLKEQVSRTVKVGISASESPDAMLARVEAAVASAEALSVTYVSTFMATVLDDTTAAAARTTLGARGEADDVLLAAGKKIIFEGTSDDAFECTLDPGNPTADVTLTLPNKSGTVATTDDIPAAELPTLGAGDVGKSLVVGAGPAAAVGSSVVQGTAKTFSGETSHYFTIPDWVNKFSLTFHNIVMSASAPVVQLGTSGGPVTSGYGGNLIGISGGSVSASALSTGLTFNTPSQQSGVITFRRVNGNVWSFRGTTSRTASGSTDEFNGTVDVGSTMSRVYMTSGTGSATYNSGTANVQES